MGIGLLAERISDDPLIKVFNLRAKTQQKLNAV